MADGLQLGGTVKRLVISSSNAHQVTLLTLRNPCHPLLRSEQAINAARSPGGCPFWRDDSGSAKPENCFVFSYIYCEKQLASQTTKNFANVIY